MYACNANNIMKFYVIMLVVNIISGFSTIVLLQFLSEVFESEQLVTQKHGRYLVPRQSRVVASICKLFTRPH